MGRIVRQIGAHVSVAGGLEKAFGRGEELGCRAIQIFVKNPNQWRAKALTKGEVEAFRRAREESEIESVVAHASYLVNLAATDRSVRGRSRTALVDELTRCGRLGVDALILHPGAHLGQGIDRGVERAAAEIDRAVAAVPAEGAARLLLENTAGQGTVLGRRLEELAAIRERLEQPERVGVCIDTCHAFAAGYPLHQKKGYYALFAELGDLLGFETLACLHLNDSARPFDSRRDRHAHLGEGAIGRPTFKRLLHDRRLARVPMIIETETGPDLSGHRRDLELLRALE